jgi:PKD repeat protein
VFDPVCVTTSQGDTLTFDNLCWAQCFGFDSTDLVTCSGCLCPDIYDPVCVDLGNGNFETFDNACLAACEGFDSTDFVDCDSVFDCSICPTVFDPVCVATGDGQLFLFSNLCFAQCQGFDSTEIFDCSDLPLCFADFSFSTDPNDPLTLTFVDSSFANAQIIEWVWDFGDGSTATGPQVTHTYDQPGNYFVTLSIAAADSCTNFVTYHVVVGGGGTFNGPDCSAMFSFEQVDSAGGNGLTFQFEDLSMGNPDSWQWNFGDGNSSALQNPVHTYADPGLYWMTLTVQDSACTDEMSILIFAGPDDDGTTDCQALFTAFFAPDSLTVFFLDLSSANTPIVSYAWDFGDGNTSTDQFGWNTYDAAGTYNVTLTITTADGCTSTFELTIDLSDQTMQGRAANQLTATESPASPGEPLRLFPNPVTDQLQLEFDMDRAGEVQYRVFNPEGRTLRSQSQTLGAGAQRLELSLSDLPAGMYFLQLQRNGQPTTRRFVKR